MASDSNKSRWDSQINKLKEQREKREQGIAYSAVETPKTEREIKNSNKNVKEPSISEKDRKSDNPYVRTVTLEELINISREMKGKEPVPAEKKTPFISASKEIKTPSLGKS